MCVEDNETTAKRRETYFRPDLKYCFCPSSDPRIRAGSVCRTNILSVKFNVKFNVNSISKIHVSVLLVFLFYLIKAMTIQKICFLKLRRIMYCMTKYYCFKIVCVQLQNYDPRRVWLYQRHDSKWLNFISHSNKKTEVVDGFEQSGSCSIWMLKSRIRGRVCVGRVRVRALNKQRLILF